MQENNEERHSELGSSLAEIYTKCSGVIFLKRQLPPIDPEIPHLKSGRAEHKVCEIALGDWLNYRLEGTDPEIRLNFLTEATQEMVENAKKYAHIVWEKMFNCTLSSATWGIEDRLILNEEFDVAGIADTWLIDIDPRAKRFAAITDYKSGYWPKDAEDNPQLAFLAVAIQNEMRRRGKDLDYVKGGIYQPRRQDGKVWSEYIFTAKILEKWRKKFDKVIEQVYVKKKPIFKTGDHCRWCPAQGACEAYAKKIQTDNALVFAATDKSFPTVETLSDDQILDIWKKSDVIQAFLKSVKAYIMQRALRGEDIAGTKCVEGRSKRQWIQDLPLIKQTLESLGVTDVTSEKMKTLTEIERNLVKVIGRKEAKIALEPIVTHTRPSLNIVGEEDPRPKISNLTSVFETIEETEDE